MCFTPTARPTLPRIVRRWSPAPTSARTPSSLVVVSTTDSSPYGPVGRLMHSAARTPLESRPATPVNAPRMRRMRRPLEGSFLQLAQIVPRLKERGSSAPREETSVESSAWRTSPAETVRLWKASPLYRYGVGHIDPAALVELIVPEKVTTSVVCRCCAVRHHRLTGVHGDPVNKLLT